MNHPQHVGEGEHFPNMHKLDINESKEVFSLLSLQKKQKRIKVNVWKQ